MASHILNLNMIVLVSLSLLKWFDYMQGICNLEAIAMLWKCSEAINTFYTQGAPCLFITSLKINGNHRYPRISAEDISFIRAHHYPICNSYTL